MICLTPSWLCVSLEAMEMATTLIQWTMPVVLLAALYRIWIR